MAGRGSSLLFLFACCLAFHSTHGGYLITTPKEITAGYPTQFCVFVTDPASPAGSVLVTVNDDSIVNFSVDTGETTYQQFFNKTIDIPSGKTEKCEDLDVPGSDTSRGSFKISGNVSGKKIDHTSKIRLSHQDSTNERVFIQTDRHFYQAGETVQFRILTIEGPYLNISTDNYPEVWLETPSKTRIAQWLDVDNTQGIVHLNMTLVDEPEEGYYNIKVKTTKGSRKTQSFKVGEFVLPKFEVEIKRPSYVLSLDDGFNLTVCAKYTFGQPVKGNLTFNIDNGQHNLCRVERTVKENVTGCRVFEFTTAEMKVTDCNVYSMSVSVNFEEEGTGIQRSTSSSVSITRNPVNIKEVYADKYMKPNVPTTVKVRVEYPDGSPAAGVPVEVCAAGKCNNMTTAPNGLFTAVLPEYTTNRIFMKTLNCRADINTASYSKNMEHFFSPSNSSLLIHAPEDELKCSSEGATEHILPVLFSATNQTSAVITVQVVSRGQMQFWNTKEYPLVLSDFPFNNEDLVEPLRPPPKDTVRGVLNIPVTLPVTTSPKAKVLVWYTRDDGEVVSDAREVRIEKCLTNSAKLTWTVEQAQPGDRTTVSLSSKPNSVCSLGVVDRSTLLLSEAPDKINLDRLFNFVNNFDISPWSNSQINDYTYCTEKERKELAGTLTEGQDLPLRSNYDYYSLYVDTIKMFEESGLYVFTDLDVETRPCEKRGVIPIPEQIFFSISGGLVDEALDFAQEAPQSSFAGGAARPESGEKTATDEDSSSDSNAPRTEFPETWLWDIVVVPSTGVLDQTVTLPDTITEWVGTAVCALPTAGVGVSGESSIRTFLPFFTDLTLPPSIKRGEILPVKISVFNYLNQALPVTVRLDESPEYEILDDPTKQGVKGQRTTCLAAQDKEVFTVRINALSLGDVNLTVTAYVDYENSQSCNVSDTSITRRDTIIKPIKVEAEGYPREKTWTKYICSQDLETGEDGLEVWDVSTPSLIVEGSERGWVTAMGDLLGLTLENLGSLIRMPYGCGEQNMINFVPNIYIMQYLDTTLQNTPETKEKLLRFMNTGYRRELLYRRNDGSFSAFGSADDSGSTWLTAFVLKSFAQAQPYILVDKAALNETRTWLQDTQDRDGCFLSIGKVFHKGMKGGITGGNGSIPLTTYVMISLLEAGENPSSETIALAQKCINSNTTTDPYTIALKAYAFALAKLPQAKGLIDQLLDLAVVTKNAISWALPKSPSKSKSVELETAAYAILAMVKQDFDVYEPQARKIVKWITSKRNGRGGFYSTQDTVMALQALASYETFLYQGPLDVKTSVSANDLTHSFAVTDSNKLLQQLVSLPTISTNVTLTMEGQGCAVLQAVLRYNIPEPEASDAFDLTVNTRTEIDRNCKTKLITACASYRLPDEQSNMAVIEVNLVSGYIPEKEDLKKLVRNNRKVVKRYEVDGNKVSFYIEELTPKATCVNFRVLREVDVENVKPGTVVVYDYYQPEFSVSENYTLPAADECRY